MEVLLKFAKLPLKESDILKFLPPRAMVHFSLSELML